jgi:hypothetical protein
MRRYGEWAGNPAGIQENVTCCVAEFYDGWVFRQCARKRGHGKEGLYCKQHAKRHPAELVEEVK